MKKWSAAFLLLISLLILTTIVSAQELDPTVLDTGDLAIIGFNSDGTDDFTVVVLKEIKAGTEIRFTDRGWRNTNPIGFVNKTDDTVIFFIPALDLNIGSVFHLISGDNGQIFNLDPGADQLFAYIGNGPDVYKVIFGINTSPSGWLDSSTDPNLIITKNNSELPPVLKNGSEEIASISLPGARNAHYIGSRSFTSPTDALNAIVNLDNWRTSGTRLNLLTTNFEFTPTNVSLKNFSAQVKANTFVYIILILPTILLISFYYLKNRKQNL